MAKKQAGKKTRPATSDERTFEEALAELEKIVGQLEEGQLGLSDSLARYEQGAACLKQCYQELRRAERKIELLMGVDEAGQAQTEPFGEAEMSLEEKQQARGRRRSRAGSGGAEGRSSKPKLEPSDGQPEVIDDPDTLF